MNLLLIIDGDNISPNTFSSKWETLEKEPITEKVLYGDFSKTEMVNWQKFAVENNITLYHCPRNNKKQTTDLNIFIDVMTKLYENNFDELLLVTNDSDFILLANAWIKKGKKVTFYSSNNCSTLIKKNFKVVMLTTKRKSKKNNIPNEEITKILDNITQDKSKKKTTENIKFKLLQFLENNCETSIKNIQNELELYYGRVKPKRIKKLLEKMESNYLWIIEDEKCFEESKVLYYPKLEEIKKENKSVKTIKTFNKKIKKVYPNFCEYLSFKTIDEIFEN